MYYNFTYLEKQCGIHIILLNLTFIFWIQSSICRGSNRSI